MLRSLLITLLGVKIWVHIGNYKHTPPKNYFILRQKLLHCALPTLLHLEKVSTLRVTLTYLCQLFCGVGEGGKGYCHGLLFQAILFPVRYSVNRSHGTLLIITWHFYIRFSYFVDFYFVRDVYCGVCRFNQVSRYCGFEHVTDT